MSSESYKRTRLPEAGREVMLASETDERPVIYSFPPYQLVIISDAIVGAGENPQPELSGTTQRLYELLKYTKEPLTLREYRAICLRFGIPDGNGMLLREVGEVLGRSPSYVSEAVKSGLGKINHREPEARIKSLLG